MANGVTAGQRRSLTFDWTFEPMIEIGSRETVGLIDGRLDRTVSISPLSS